MNKMKVSSILTKLPSFEPFYHSDQLQIHMRWLLRTIKALTVETLSVEKWIQLLEIDQEDSNMEINNLSDQEILKCISLEIELEMKD